MGSVRWSVILVAAVGIAAALIAGATIWLLFTDPVQVASAVSSGDVGLLLEAVGLVLLNALRAIFGAVGGR